MLCHVSYVLYLSALASLTAAQTLTSCTIAAQTPLPKGSVCGQEGSISDPGRIFSGSTPHMQACRDLCVTEQSQCASFSYGPGKKCNTYYRTIANSGFTKSTTSKTYFWGKGCFEKTCGLCPTGLKACKKYCKNAQSDPKNCGTCGNICKGGKTCQSGQCLCPQGQVVDGLGNCRPPCPAGSVYCGDTCQATNTDINNCGSCGHACGDGSCIQGTCTCPTGSDYCGPQTCLSLDSDDNCGKCGNQCTGGSSCVNQTCTCSSGQSYCNGNCVDEQNDYRNCGSCGNFCGEGALCSSGNCQCYPGLTKCVPSGCVDIGHDPDNCGSCNNPVGQSEICCSGTPKNYNFDPNNCGACNNVCLQGEYCEQGKCMCNPGGDCLSGDMCITSDISNGGQYDCGYTNCCFCSPPQSYGCPVQYFQTYSSRAYSLDPKNAFFTTIFNVTEGEGGACRAVSQAEFTSSHNGIFPAAYGLYWSKSTKYWTLSFFSDTTSQPVYIADADLAYGYAKSNVPKLC